MSFCLSLYGASQDSNQPAHRRFPFKVFAERLIAKVQLLYFSVRETWLDCTDALIDLSSLHVITAGVSVCFRFVLMEVLRPRQHISGHFGNVASLFCGIFT